MATFSVSTSSNPRFELGWSGKAISVGCKYSGSDGRVGPRGQCRRPPLNLVWLTKPLHYPVDTSVLVLNKPERSWVSPKDGRLPFPLSLRGFVSLVVRSCGAVGFRGVLGGSPHRGRPTDPGVLLITPTEDPWACKNNVRW